jgi:AcrR family transcriptional regulator
VNQEGRVGGGTRPARAAGRAGRPRSASADQAITTATLALLAEQGPRGVTVESVAQRSGVAKTTIYRRYRDRRELLRAALAVVAEVVEPDPARPVWERITTLLEQFRYGVEHVVGVRVVATLLLGTDDPEFTEVFRQLLRTRLALIRRIFDAGIAAGDLRPDVDYDRVVDALFGSFFARTAISGEVVPDWAESMVALLRPAISARA